MVILCSSFRTKIDVWVKFEHFFLNIKKHIPVCGFVWPYYFGNICLDWKHSNFCGTACICMCVVLHLWCVFSYFQIVRLDNLSVNKSIRTIRFHFIHDEKGHFEMAFKIAIRHFDQFIIRYIAIIYVLGINGNRTKLAWRKSVASQCQK